VGHQDDIDILHLFGTRVRELRHQRGWSQEDLANTAELDRTYVSGIERGVRNVALRSIQKLAVALNVSPKDLLDF
jgi:transcriptional regulator with XRE-family HTH domain